MRRDEGLTNLEKQRQHGVGFLILEPDDAACEAGLNEGGLFASDLLHYLVSLIHQGLPGVRSRRC